MARGGNNPAMQRVPGLSRFARSITRAGEPVWFAVAVAVYAIQEFGISHLGQDGGEAVLRRILFFTTTAVVVGLAFRLRRYVGAWLIAIGILMNVLPMAAHGGLMPVAFEVIEESGAFPEITEEDIGRQVPNSKDIVLYRDDIHFELLSDRFFLEVPGYGPNIYSAGDFVAFAGLALAAVQIIVGLFRPASQPKPVSSSQV